MIYGHLAHFAGNDEDALVDRLVDYFNQAAARDGVCLMVTNPQRHAAVALRLPEDAIVEFIDGETAVRLMYRNGRIDPHAFDHVIASTMRDLVHRHGARPVYAYGDMVGLLWDWGDRAAAKELESFWTDLGSQLPFKLFCAYPHVDAAEWTSVDGRDIAALHTHVV